MVPLVYLGLRASERGVGGVLEVLARPRVLELTVSSVGLSLAVAASCLALGVPTAWLVTRARLPWRPLWLVLAGLPLAVPSYIAAYGWLMTVPGLSGFTGAWLVLTLVSTPYVTLPVAAALRSADPDAEHVARTLGRGRFAAFWTATWPQVRSAASAGALLVCLYVLSDFGAVAMMRYPAFTWAIQSAYGSSFDRIYAAVLALLLVALAAVAVVAERRLRGRSVRLLSSTHHAGRVQHADLGRLAPLAAAALAAVAAAAVAVPVVALFRRMLLGTGVRFDLGSLLEAAGATVAVSLAGAALAVLLALPVGVLAARYRGRAVAAVESASALGQVLPGIVLGLALVVLTLAVLPGMYQTTTVLAVAYAILFLPKAVGAVRVSTALVPTSLEDVAQTLGRRPARVWWGVTARLAWPGTAAGGLLVALTAMKELPATLMLRPTGTETLATELWTRTSVQAWGSAAPYALTLMLVASVPAFLLSGVVRRRGIEEAT